LLKTSGKASLWQGFFSYFTSTNEFDIFRQCMYIVFILKCWKAQDICQVV